MRLGSTGLRRRGGSDAGEPMTCREPEAQAAPDPAGDGPAAERDAPARAALAARAAGRHVEAAEAWRALLRRFPENWQAALELKRDMAAGGRYAESDPLFRRAARFLPDEEWLAHYGGIYAFHGAELEALQARARQILARRPDDAAVHAVLGDLARQERDLAAAEAHYTHAVALSPDRADYDTGLRVVRRYRLLQCWMAEQPPGGDEYAIALVNLDRNGERRAEMARQLHASHVPVFRVPGVEGALLPLAAVRSLTGRRAEAGSRGTLGCFLGHVAAWEAMLARGLAHCLILEDDVIPLLPLPSRLGLLGLPAGWDLCFVNDRMAPLLAGEADGFQTVSLAHAVRTFALDHNAPGADGYLLSTSGALKLLAWVAKDGFAGDVDWRLLAYGLPLDDVASLPQGSHARKVLGTMTRRFGRAERLRAHVLCPALIRTVPVSSDREDANRVE